MALYLGLDSSTQSLSALLLDTDSGQVVLDHSVQFGRDLPEYRAPQGFLETSDPNVRHSDPLMWVAALDLLFEQLCARGAPLGTVVGISGAGQQHGSVYLNTSLSDVDWSSKLPLAPQIAPLLSRKTSPIWMDSSTAAECREIAAALGGDDRVVAISGSRAIERFTGPQIRKFWKQEPAAYEATAEIHLVSSFMASVLAGRSVPTDYGDAAGMNLFDLQSLEWSLPLLEATAPNLGRRLHAPVPSSTRVGSIARYFVEKYGFRAGTPLVAFTGDNPSSLVGMGAVQPGTAVVSLGTSDTVFAAMSEPRTDPRGFGHVFGNPAGGFMCLICFANGSLARERVAERVGLDWGQFEHAILKQSKPGNGGALLLPYFAPETTPKLLKPEVRLFGDEEFTSFRDPARAARGIVEAQALAMLRYSDWIGHAPKTILATGGAARNRGILQVIADVFQAEVRSLKVGNSSGLGAALRAAQAVGGLSWESLFAAFAAPDPELRVLPTPHSEGSYGALARRFSAEVDALVGA